MNNKQMTGADIAYVRKLGTIFDQEATRIRDRAAHLNALIEGLDWKGPDRERFVSEWRSNHLGALNAIAAQLETGASSARKSAAAQERISRA